MNKIKRIGILLIIIGVFIPLVLYPFTTVGRLGALKQMAHFNKGSKYDLRVTDLEVVFVSGTKTDSDKLLGVYVGKYDNRLAISYKYLLTFGIFLTFIGIGIVALYREKRH